MKLVRDKEGQGGKQPVQVVVQERQVRWCYQLQGERQGDRSSCISLSDSVLPCKGEVSMRARVHQGKEKGTEANSHRASVRFELGGLG